MKYDAVSGYLKDIDLKIHIQLFKNDFIFPWKYRAVLMRINKWVMSWENLFMIYANNKGADQPAHLRNLISTFVVCCLDSLISLVSISEISSL